MGKIARRRRQARSNPAGPIGPWRSPRLEYFRLQKNSSPKPCGDEIQGAGNWRSGAGRCDKTTGLFLTDQTACHIDPAIGPDHARDPDTILVFASSGAAELKSWTHAMRIGRFGFAGVLRWPINLGYRGDGHRRREHCRTKAGDGDTCQGAFN